MNTLLCSNYDQFSCSFGEVDRHPKQAILYVTELDGTSYSHCQIVSPRGTHFFSFHTKHHLRVTIDMDNDNIRNNKDVIDVKKIFRRYKNMDYIKSFGNGVIGSDFHEFLILSARIPALANHYSRQEMVFNHHSFAVNDTTYDYLAGTSEDQKLDILAHFITCENGEIPIATKLFGWLQFICFEPTSVRLQCLGFEVVTKFKWPICYNMAVANLDPFWSKKHSGNALEAMKAYKESMEAYYPFMTDSL